MNRNKVFYHIRAPYRKSLIYTRLGYEKKKTSLEPIRRKQIEQWIREAEDICDVTLIYRQKPVERVSDDRVVLAEGINLISQSLARLFLNAGEAVLMAATGGRRIMDEIGKMQDAGEMSKALVYDAAASEITDAALDWLMAFLKQPLIRTGQTLTPMRYSPGYGDLDLSNQKVFYDILNLETYGVRLTSKYMFIPEKTVTAIAGIQKPKDINKK